MELKPGTRLRSVCCSTQVIVVKASASDLVVECGGRTMVAATPGAVPEPDGAPEPPFADGTAIGKRYRDDDGGLELLCTSPGAGSLAVGGVALAIVGAKPLPSSD